MEEVWKRRIKEILGDKKGEERRKAIQQEIDLTEEEISCVKQGLKDLEIKKKILLDEKY